MEDLLHNLLESSFEDIFQPMSQKEFREKIPEYWKELYELIDGIADIEDVENIDYHNFDVDVYNGIANYWDLIKGIKAKGYNIEKWRSYKYHGKPVIVHRFEYGPSNTEVALYHETVTRSNYIESFRQ